MRDEKAFTLIEIIAVVIIIGVLSLIIVPSVTSYITNSRNTAYNAHELSMEEAAKEMTVEVINGKDNYVLPKSGNFSNVTLKELIDKELIKSIQDPQTGEKCNQEMSHVIIKAINENDYDFKACLYCGAYVTNSDECDGTGIEDATAPICGTITGESSEWTNKSRTITVGCSDPESSCKKSKYSQTFNTTMETGEISIYNSAGVETKCPVTVKVDKTKPTCELEIVGDDNTESTGWTSGRNVVIKMTSYSDGEHQSGVATYGMGTSSKKANYNGKTSYEIQNITGTTTVFGYVKDNAGNEGMCYTTVTTGLEKPVFDVRYGFQIYPEKERFSLTNVSITASNKLKTSDSGEHIVKFTHMGKYNNVTAMIIDSSTEISDPMSWKLTVGSNTYTAEAESTTRLRFNIETEPALNSVSSSNEYTLKLGNEHNKEYIINRIEIEQRTGSLKAKYPVAANLITRKQVVRTTKWSWDNGSSWKTRYYYTFDVRSSAKSGTAIIKNDIPLVSNGVSYSIVRGDGDNPIINITPSTTEWTNQNVILTARVQDSNSGLIGYMWSTSGNLTYYDNSWIYLNTPITSEKAYTFTVESNGTYYFYAKDEAGNVTKKAINVTNIDKTKPVCSFGTIPDVYVNRDATIDLTCTDTGSGINIKNLLESAFTYNEYLSIKSITTTRVSNGVKYTLTLRGVNDGTSPLKLKTDQVFDLANNGNEEVGIEIKVNGVFLVTLDNQSAATAGTASLYELYTIGWFSDAAVSNELTSITKPTKTGYTFGGYYTETSGAGTQIIGDDGKTISSASDSYTDDGTAYAKWNPNPLIFNGGTIDKSYSTSAQTETFTAATNGTGTYTYKEVSEKNSSGTATSYISVSGTKITINAKTPAGSYTYVVKATDSNSGSKKDATFTINIAKVDVSLDCANKDWNDTVQTIATCSGGTLSNHTRKDAGSQVVTCTGDDNHNTKTATCSINKVASSVRCTNKPLSSHSVLVAIGEGCEPDPKYVSNGGTHTITCKGDTNHNDSTVKCHVQVQYTVRVGCECICSGNQCSLNHDMCYHNFPTSDPNVCSNTSTLTQMCKNYCYDTYGDGYQYYSYVRENMCQIQYS